MYRPEVLYPLPIPNENVIIKPVIQKDSTAFTDFLQRESQYNQQISKMNDVILELRNTISSKDIVITNIKSEMESMRIHIEGHESELGVYKETLKKLYMVYIEQQKYIESMNLSNIDLVSGLDQMSSKNLEINNEMKNIVTHNEILKQKLSEDDRKRQADISNLTAQLHDKNLEISDLKRRVNDLLDIKRRVEEEAAALRFALDNTRIRMETELKEKQLKIDQMDRAFQEASLLRNQDLTLLNNDLRRLESERGKLLDENRNLTMDLIDLRKLLKEKENNFKDMERDLKEKELEYKSRSTFEGKGSATKHKSRSQDRIDNDYEYRDPIDELGNDRLSQSMDKRKFIKQHDQDWKHQRCNLCEDKTKELSRLRREMEDLRIQLEEVRAHAGSHIVPDSSQDLEFTYQISDGMISVISYVREAINSIIFEIFVRSINHANQRKLNSLILFILNLRELKDKYWKGLLLALDIYERMRKSLKGFLDVVGSTRYHTTLAQKLSLAMGHMLKQDVEFRDNVNKWIEGTLAFTITKKTKEKNEKNRDFLFLFRLMTIKYRIRYPLRGKSFTVDVDLDAYLENKICTALQKVLRSELE